MFPQQGGGFPQNSNNNSNYPDTARSLAMVCAIIVTLIASPQLGTLTEPWIEKIIIESYGVEYIDFGIFIYKSLLYALIYYASKLFLVGAIVTAALALATKVPMLAA